MILRLKGRHLINGAGGQPPSGPLSSSGFFVYSVKRLSDGMEYIGVTNLEPEERWLSHVAVRRRGGKGSLGEAIRLAGMDRRAFSVRVLRKFGPNQAAEAALAEKHLIAVRGTRYPNGFNMNKGGTVGFAGAGVRFQFRGMVIYGVRSLARYIGRSESTIWARIRSGWTLAQIFEQAPPPPRRPLRLRKRRQYRMLDGRLRSAKSADFRRRRRRRE